MKFIPKNVKKVTSIIKHQIVYYFEFNIFKIPYKQHKLRILPNQVTLHKLESETWSKNLHFQTPRLA